MLTPARVRRRFPEAREAPGDHGGTEYFVHCPRPHRKGAYNFKLSINGDTGAFCCHDCGYAGNAFEEWFDGVDEYFAHLSVEPAAVLPSAAVRRPSQVLDEWMDGVPAPGRVRPLAELRSDHPAWAYLVGRGFDEEEIRAFGPADALYYCEEGAWTKGGGTNGGRIVFPVYLYGHLHGWQARTVERRVAAPDGTPSHKLTWNGKEWLRYPFDPRTQKYADEAKGIPKYNTCPGMQRSQCLYGFDTARQFRSVVEVEGPLDRIAVGPEAVATMGGNGVLSLGQAKLLVAGWESVVRLLDPGVDTERPGYQRTLEHLAAVPTTCLKLSNGRDPGSTPRAEIWADITAALSRTSKTTAPPCNSTNTSKP